MTSSAREVQLQRLIVVLWNELRSVTDTRDLEQDVRRSGLGWALPTSGDFRDDDDWVTPDEIAYDLGYTQSAVRNWPTRYGLKTVKGRYRWGDVQDLITARNQRNHHRRTG